MKDGTVAGASRDRQSITSDWEFTAAKRIDGVIVREVKNVPKGDGHLVELYRSDWGLDQKGIDQVFMVSHLPGAISAWHAHPHTTDRLFVAQGMARIVLYDGRRDSPTYGEINEIKLGTLRPALVVVPPEIWHGIQSIGEQSALVVNMVDRAYEYSDPDHWRVPSDSSEIPYQWE